MKAIKHEFIAESDRTKSEHINNKFKKMAKLVKVPVSHFSIDPIFIGSWKSNDISDISDCLMILQSGKQTVRSKA